MFEFFIDHTKEKLFWGVRLLISSLVAIFFTVFSSAVGADVSLLTSSNTSGYQLSASHSDAYAPVSNINDYFGFTYWSNYGNDENYHNDVINIDFNVPTKVTKVSIKSEYWKKVNLEYFDGDDWQLAEILSLDYWSESFYINDITAQRWRLRDAKTLDNDPTQLSISDFKMYGQSLEDDQRQNVLDQDTVIELSQAPVDECFFDVGDERNIYPKPEGEPCPEGSEEKRNEAYLWGLTAYTDETVSKLYFGTGANVFCIGVQNYLKLEAPIRVPGSFACRNGYKNDDPLGDQRPPSIYIYDIETDQRSKPELDQKTKSLLEMTIGLRSAGEYRGIVFLAGPNLNNSISIIAMNGATGELIDSTNYDSGFTSVRKMKQINGDWYVAVGGAELNTVTDAGSMLRWKGDSAAILAGNTETLFDFEVVGTDLDSEATELNIFEDRIFVSSWPNQYSAIGGGLWKSPEFPLPTEGETKLVWDTATSGAVQLNFSLEGNLELVTDDSQVLFSSNTENLDAVKAVIQNNAKLVIYDSLDNILWSSDPSFAPLFMAENSLAIQDAVTLYPGDSLYAGQEIKSENELVSLSLTQSGNLELRKKSLPWTRVWGAEDYDPDPFVATTYGISQTIEKDGWLYWGTLHVPGAALSKLRLNYGNTVLTYAPQLVAGFHRGTSLFRGRNLGTQTEEIELLYGGYHFKGGASPGEYPVHLAYESYFGNLWSVGLFDYRMNKMGQVPKYGREGFGNTLNNYLWNMIEYNGDIYMGTFDQSDLSDSLVLGLGLWPNIASEPGADLYKFDNNTMSAQPVFLDGGTSPISYGIRNTVVVGDDMYIGTASNASLNPEGGWRLMKLTAESLANPQ